MSEFMACSLLDARRWTPRRRARPPAEPRLRDSRKVDVRVVDAVEDVGEDGQRDRQADVDQLRVGVAGGADRLELGLADRAAGPDQPADEMDQRIALGVTRRPAGPDLPQDVGL